MSECRNDTKISVGRQPEHTGLAICVFLLHVARDEAYANPNTFSHVSHPRAALDARDSGDS